MSIYKPNKRMLKKGEISLREDFFQNKGYEYTLYITDHSELVQALEQLAASTRWLKIKRFDDTYGLVCSIGWDTYFEVSRIAKKEVTFSDGTTRLAVRYVAYFQQWHTYELTPGLGDELNKVLTLLELTFIKMDPLTWVREIPVKITHKNEAGSSRINWFAEPPEIKITQEEAAKKNLHEYYLADKLNQTGLTVYGGTPVAQEQKAAPNPLIEERIKKNLEYTEKKRNEEPPKKLCASCGAELIPDSRFCIKCGAEIVKTYQEKMDEEKGLKKYPPMFITEIGEEADPFIFARIDENKNIIEEPQDHRLKGIPLAALYIDYKENNTKGFVNLFSSVANNDNLMYISDSRVAFINRNYNKNEAGGWIGFGGVSAFVVAEILNHSSKAIKAAERRDKAFAGHIRYEWLGLIAYKSKVKLLEKDIIRFYYKDEERTIWQVRVELQSGYDCASLANDIVRRVAVYRSSLNKERKDDENQFIQRYVDGKGKIPPPETPGGSYSEELPGNCCASKGSFMRQ